VVEITKLALAVAQGSDGCGVGVPWLAPRIRGELLNLASISRKEVSRDSRPNPRTRQLTRKQKRSGAKLPQSIPTREKIPD
jgi:hypothetical protein